MGAKGSVGDGTAVRVLPQGRYRVGVFGCITVVAGWLLLLSLTQDQPEEDPAVAAAAFVATAPMTLSMSRVTMHGTPTHLVVRNLVWKRPIAWTRIESATGSPPTSDRAMSNRRGEPGVAGGVGDRLGGCRLQLHVRAGRRRVRAGGFLSSPAGSVRSSEAGGWVRACGDRRELAWRSWT